MRHVLLTFAAVSMLGACHNGDSIEGKPLVSGLTISQISLFQGLEAQVMKDGAATTSPNVPVVAGKAGLLRVFVRPDGSWMQHIVRVHVEMTAGGVALPALDATQAIAVESNAADLTSTINFDLPAETVTADMTFSVGLYEVNDGSQGAADGARYPATGEVPLGATETGSVKVLLIPVQYGADGSNRMPATDETVIAAFRDRMKLLYPVRDVEITLGSPFEWNQAVDADGTGWDELLNAILYKRIDDGVAPDVYYYGLFTPSASFNQYCSFGCVLGLSPLAFSSMDDMARASIGVGFTNKDAGEEETFTHEVGHAHGRQHAPCDVDDPDRHYPYPDAEIGAWGYDPKAQVLLDPMGESRDMMSYCEPTWISDYTYKALYKRIQQVNALPYALEVPSRWQTLIVRDDKITRGQVKTLNRAPMGVDKQVERVVGGRHERFDAHFYPFDHLDGGILFVPEGEELSTLRIDGKRVQ
jgi:hypothetical protein